MTEISQIGIDVLVGVGVGLGVGDGVGDGVGVGGAGLAHVSTQNPFAPEQQPELHCAPSVQDIPFA